MAARPLSAASGGRRTLPAAAGGRRMAAKEDCCCASFGSMATLTRVTRWQPGRCRRLLADGGRCRRLLVDDGWLHRRISAVRHAAPWRRMPVATGAALAEHAGHSGHATAAVYRLAIARTRTLPRTLPRPPRVLCLGGGATPLQEALPQSPTPMATCRGHAAPRRCT